MLSTAVMVRPPLDPGRFLTPGAMLTASVPTEAEVRDALARVTRDLDEMYIARGEGWEVESFGFPEPGQEPRLVTTPDGAIALRGTVIIRRD
jgi:hypothetical protein